MKQTKIVIGLIVAVLLASCSTSDSDIDLDIKAEYELRGHHIELDSVFGIIADVRVADTSYVFRMFKSDFCLLQTDKNFRIVFPFIRKGEGPSEVIEISQYGNILSDGSFGITDPFARKLYRVNPPDKELSVECNMAESKKTLQPLHIIQRTPEEYIIVPSTFEYGIYCYNAKNDVLQNWPVGFDLGNAPDLKQRLTRFRTISYCRSKDMLAEIYGALPIVILHNASGEIERIIRYGEMPAIEQINDNSPDRFADVKLTDNHIYILYRKDENDDFDEIFIIDYESYKAVSCHIKPAMAFDVDTINRRFICVDPSSDAYNIMLYDIPPQIEKP